VVRAGFVSGASRRGIRLMNALMFVGGLAILV
jgi:hypothetical protein